MYMCPLTVTSHSTMYVCPLTVTSWMGMMRCNFSGVCTCSLPLSEGLPFDGLSILPSRMQIHDNIWILFLLWLCIYAYEMERESVCMHV